MHVLEAGDPAGPTLLLLHGFPELAFSWRELMPGLAASGRRVIAPDLRGFGRTTGADARFDADLAPFRQLSLVGDLLALLRALGVAAVDAVIGHDFGAVLAAWTALVRPDVCRAVVMMSAPFSGPPGFAPAPDAEALDRGMAGLSPPRRHYASYFSLPNAAAEMAAPPEGLAAFLRAYFHAKSGDHPANRPHPLKGAGPDAFAALPPYYVMPRALDMPSAVRPLMPAPEAAAACPWLTPADLEVYRMEYARTGFQGGLNWYRARSDPGLCAFAGRAVEVPAAFIAGDRDWGVRQTPGAFEAMASRGCSRLRRIELIPGAGHWVQQEAPEAVLAALLAFLNEAHEA
jgi:pimeloyl-ACP methyl ester carboxylesterase